MKKTTFYFSFLFVFLFSACYTDDSSIPDPDVLPFRSFTEFFEQSRAEKDTLTFNSEEVAVLTPIGGNSLTIPVEAFSEEGTLSIAFLEAENKSDFIFYDWPTQSGDNWLQTSEAMLVEAFKGQEAISNANDLEWELNLFEETATDGLQIYSWNNDWNLESNIEIAENSSSVQFQGDEGKGYVAAKSIDSESVQLSVTPTAYGNIPNDMRVFIATKEGNTVLTLDSDVSTVTASGKVPKNVELHVIVMVMDFYRLDAGMETMTLNNDMSIELRLSKMTPVEMMEMIRAID